MCWTDTVYVNIGFEINVHSYGIYETRIISLNLWQEDINQEIHK